MEDPTTPLAAAAAEAAAAAAPPTVAAGAPTAASFANMLFRLPPRAAAWTSASPHDGSSSGSPGAASSHRMTWSDVGALDAHTAAGESAGGAGDGDGSGEGGEEENEEEWAEEDGDEGDWDEEDELEAACFQYDDGGLRTHRGA